MAENARIQHLESKNAALKAQGTSQQKELDAMMARLEHLEKLLEKQ